MLAPIRVLPAPGAFLLSAALLAAAAPAAAVTILDRTMTVTVEFGSLDVDTATERRDPTGATSTEARVGIGGSAGIGTYSAVGLVDAANGFYRISGRTPEGPLRARVISTTTLVNDRDRTVRGVYEFGIADGFVQLDAFQGVGSWLLDIGAVPFTGGVAGPAERLWFSEGFVRAGDDATGPLSFTDGVDIGVRFERVGPGSFFPAASFPVSLHIVDLPDLAPGARLDIVSAFNIGILPIFPFEAVSSFGFTDPNTVDGFPLERFAFTPLDDGPPVAPIPLPAPALTLFAALGALAAFGRRRLAVAAA